MHTLKNRKREQDGSEAHSVFLGRKLTYDFFFKILAFFSKVTYTYSLNNLKILKIGGENSHKTYHCLQSRVRDPRFITRLNWKRRRNLG